MTVLWKKDAKVTGYQIQYSTKSNMKNASMVTVTKKSKVKSVLTGLKKGKTYYIQVRSYYIVDKKKNTALFGTWSNKKKVKINQ